MAQGYGTDTWCTNKLRPGKMVSGAALVAQALFRRTITPRGALRGLGESGDEGGAEDELAYGFDLAGYVGAVGAEVAAQAVPSILAAEFEKDDRVVPGVLVEPTVTEENGEVGLELACFVDLVDEAEQLNFTIGVSAGVASLLSVSGVSV